MAAKKQTPTFPPPRTPLTLSPSLSAVRPSPLLSETSLSCSVTSSPLTSSPTLSYDGRGTTASPDLFDDLKYSEAMEVDFRRIDMQAAEYESIHASSPMRKTPNTPSPPPTPVRDRKTWVVFRGKTPGIYDDGLSVAYQTQGYSDGFHKLFPSRDTAMAAWNAYIRDGTYPDYGRGPWVVYLGHRPGVISKISELEASVKSFNGPIFKSCSSVAEGNIKFQLFSERVTQMFSGPDPFSGVAGLLPQKSEGGSRKAVPAALKRPLSPFALQVAESSKTASKRNASGSSLTPSRKSKVPRPGDGWYVAHKAVVPGVYYGVDKLKAAQPIPGGFRCTRDEESANQLFLDLTLDGAVVWTKVRE